MWSILVITLKTAGLYEVNYQTIRFSCNYMLKNTQILGAYT